MTQLDAVTDDLPSTQRPRVRAMRHVGAKLIWPVLALAILLLIDLLFIRHFFHLDVVNGRLTGSLVDICRWGAPVMLLSIGMTLVLATGGVDLSVGAVMALAGAVAAKASMPAASGGLGLSPIFAMIVAIVASMAAGAWNGLLVAILDVQPIVATLVLMVGGRGIGRLLIGAANIPLAGVAWDRLGGTTFGLPTAPLLAIALLLLTALFTRRTAVALFIEAIGGNPVASRYAGVRVRWITFLTYVFCASCAGLAGLAAAADVHIANASEAGMYKELDAILAVVIGGTALTGGRFSLVGSMIGALLIQTLTTTLIYKVPVQQTLVVKAIVVIGVCLLQSETFRNAAIKALRVWQYIDVRRCKPLPPLPVRRERAGVRASDFCMQRVSAIRADALTLPFPGVPGEGKSEASNALGTERNSRSSESRAWTWLLHPRFLPLLVTAAVCALLYIATALRYPGFLSAQVFVDLFSGNAPLGITAVGLTFVILAGGIDLSVASVMALATMILASASQRLHLPPAIGIAGALAAGAMVGWINGALVRYFDLPPFLVTLATLFLARGACFLISMEPIAPTAPFFASFGDAGIDLGAVSIRLGLFVLLVAVFVGIAVAQMTRFGRTVYAIGGGEQAARLMGLPIGRTKVWVYTISGLCAAAGGIMSMATIPSGDPTKYLGLELDAIAAVVIGGTLLTGGVGYVAGTLLGVLILGIIQDVITFDGTRDAAWTQITTGFLLFVFVAMQKMLGKVRGGEGVGMESPNDECPNPRIYTE
jgi:simple sugar transport system permease protein